MEQPPRSTPERHLIQSVVGIPGSAGVRLRHRISSVQQPGPPTPRDGTYPRSSLNDPYAYLETRVALIAGDALPPLGYSYGAHQRVVVLPWHTEISLAKSVIVDHTDAWGARLDAYVEDSTSVASAPFGAAISGT